ncbi:MAG: DUF4382 domain-containing protein [Candidatus Aminicenantes bacterium]|nr:MAG: DUF4382 domain-containing protein [Candidatus Aminicenantes bacterium]
MRINKRKVNKLLFCVLILVTIFTSAKSMNHAFGGEYAGIKVAEKSSKFTLSEKGIEKVIIEIEKIEVNHEDLGWITISEEKQKIDLLGFQNGIPVITLNKPLNPSVYNHIRLFLSGNNEIYVDGVRHQLQVPSGKLSLIGPFEIIDGKIAVVALDFNVSKSVVCTGGKRYILKPVIKIKSVAEYDGAGIVTSEGGNISTIDGIVNIQVPANAVIKGIVVTIDELATTGFIEPQTGYSFLGNAYNLKPDDHTFSKNVLLTIEYDKEELSNIGNPEGIGLFCLDENTNSWIRVPSTVSTSTNSICAKVSNFSIYSLQAITFDELAYHWAPIHFQDVNKKDHPMFNGCYDFITRVDLTGSWDISNNWDWQNFDKYVLSAWVYYSVVSTKSHHYITYAFYHPLDWKETGIPPVPYYIRNNDLEGALFIIKRDGTEWGRLEAVVTNWHVHFHAYFPSDSPLISGCKIEEQGNCWVYWQDGRVMTSQEEGGHGCGCYPAFVKENDDAVVYVPSRDTAGIPPTIPPGTHEYVSYRLIDIFEGGGLWDHRRDHYVFNPCKWVGFPPTCEKWVEFQGGHGNPPWAWDDSDDGGFCLRGQWTHDPALLAQYYFRLDDSSVNSWDYFNREYERNFYRYDMGLLTHSNAYELYSNENMSLKYWIDNYGGNCEKYNKKYPCE